jgi:hypothetical protein
MNAIKSGLKYYFTTEGYWNCCVIGAGLGGVIGGLRGAKDEVLLISKREDNSFFDTRHAVYDTVGIIVSSVEGILLGGALGSSVVALAPIVLPASICGYYLSYFKKYKDN